MAIIPISILVSQVLRHDLFTIPMPQQEGVPGLNAVKGFWSTSNQENARKALIKDHCIQGTVVMPAALFSELALSGASEVFGGDYVLEGMAFKEALILSDEIEQIVQMVFTPATKALRNVKVA